MFAQMLFLGAEPNKRCRQILEQVKVDSKYNAETVFKLLLLIGEYEFKLREVSDEFVTRINNEIKVRKTCNDN